MRHRSKLLCLNVVRFFRREIGEIVRYLPAKKNKILAPSQTVATVRIAPNICQDQSPTLGSQRFEFHPNRFTFGGVIAERVKAVLLAHRVFPWFASKTFEANKDTETEAETDRYDDGRRHQHLTAFILHVIIANNMLHKASTGQNRFTVKIRAVTVTRDIAASSSPKKKVKQIIATLPNS